MYSHFAIICFLVLADGFIRRRKSGCHLPITSPGFLVSTLFTSCIFASGDGICLPFPTCDFCLNFLVVITLCCIDDNQACHQRHLINLMNFFSAGLGCFSISTLVLVAGDCPSSNAHILANNENKGRGKKEKKIKKVHRKAW